MPAGSSLSPLDPERLVEVLADHEVDYVLIGALAARLYGFPRLTADADITPAKTNDNLDRLAEALRELEARIYTEAVPEGLPFDCSRQALEGADLWNLATAAGRLDVAFLPSGTQGYEDLVRTAVTFEVFDRQVQVASLADIIRSKEAADRPQDRQDVILLREIQRLREV